MPDLGASRVFQSPIDTVTVQCTVPATPPIAFGHIKSFHPLRVFGVHGNPWQASGIFFCFARG